MAERKILVVDDEPAAVEFVKAILEGDGTTVISASDGKAGLEAAAKEKPDLVVLDVQMPGMNGFQVFAELRKNEATAGIPVVMLTGVAEKTGIGFSKEDMGEFLGGEPAGYCEKPVDPAALQETVEKALGG